MVEKNNLNIDVEPYIVLPGYEAGFETLGVEHSKKKLCESAQRLSETLARIDPDHKSSIQTLECSTEEETWSYRCRCNFQILSFASEDDKGNTIYQYKYAMRSKGKAVSLGSQNSFPIATQRIQTAMKEFMNYLNRLETSHKGSIGYQRHLTSCTFSSSWRDSNDANCVLTLHYDHPLELIQDSWKEDALEVCRMLRLKQLNGRSKGKLLFVPDYDNSQNHPETTNHSHNKTSANLCDTIYLCDHRPKNKDDGTIFQKASSWSVSLEPQSEDSTECSVIPVHYDKPETAFYHPNPKAMTKALAWILDCLSDISSAVQQGHQQRPNAGGMKVLELYCGCGAHTVALGRSGLVSKIFAIEMDSRLIVACHQNLVQNHLQNMVELFEGDAGKWAKEESRRRIRQTTMEERNDHCDERYEYDILVVDPPRQGLDEEVCKMANTMNCFRNILYVSCGHKALLRDLERLSPCYEIMQCAQMDLFPRTDSIETLVHLKRRKSQNPVL